MSSEEQANSNASEASQAPEGADMEMVKKLDVARKKLGAEVGKVIVGMEEVIEQLLIVIFSRGHCMLEGVPGLAKTLLIATICKALDMDFARIQFTPDLMPSDITGTEVVREDKLKGERYLEFMKGPIFSNIILADEINRTPPKTQAALLEAMQERQVSAGGKRFVLPAPFFVLATMNPIEQEGTYSLPEAQLDRFMFKIFVGYPTEEEELEIIRRTTSPEKYDLQSVITKEEIIQLQEIIRKVPVSESVIRYCMALVRQTRISEKEGIPQFIRDSLAWGAGPRACQNLIMGGKARAVLHGRTYVNTDDIIAVAKPVLRHRLVLNFSAEAEGISTDDIVEWLVKNTNKADSKNLSDKRLPDEMLKS